MRLLERRTGSSTGNGDTSRGATIVEFAMIAVFLFTLIFGIIEGALVVNANSAVTNSVNEAARAGAIAGNSDDADWFVLNAIVERGGHATSDIEYVTVYNAANGSAGSDPNSCAAAGGSPVCQCLAGVPQPGVCNVYDAAEVQAVGGLRSAFLAGTIGNDWPASSRAMGNTVEFIGVYVRTDYEPILDQLFLDWQIELNANDVQAIETART